MKKLLLLLAFVAFLFIPACGPVAEEEAVDEKVEKVEKVEKEEACEEKVEKEEKEEACEEKVEKEEKEDKE